MASNSTERDNTLAVNLTGKSKEVIKIDHITNSVSWHKSMSRMCNTHPPWRQTLDADYPSPGCRPPRCRPPGCRPQPPWMQTPNPLDADPHGCRSPSLYADPSVNRMTHRCKNITLSQTSFVGCKYDNNR